MIQIQSFSNPMAREVTVQANNWLKENDYHIEVISTQMVVKSNDRILEVIIMITYKEFEEKYLTNN